MLYTSFISTALAAFSVFADGVMCGVVAREAAAIPPELELEDRSMAASTIELKFWDSLECKTSEHKKTYNSGDCLNVAGRTSVSMQKRSSGDCYITRYLSDDCTGSGQSGYNLHDCFSLKGDWESLKIRC